MEDRVDDFLMGKMSSDESSRFIEEQMNDPDLASRIELRKKIIIGFTEVYEEELKQKLIAYDRSLGTTKRLKKITLIAASILFIVVAGITFVQLTKKDTIDSFDFFEAGIPNIMNSSARKDELQLGMNAFKLESYDDAILIFEKLNNEKPSNDTLNYFLGISHYRADNIDKAIDFFNSTMVDKKSIYQEKAEFRLAIALIKGGDLNRAESILESINKDQDHSLRKLASEAYKAFFEK
jgi:tetratricopeptide (TPR) repeat protein